MTYSNHPSRLRIQRPPDEADERAAEAARSEPDEDQEAAEERAQRRLELAIDKMREDA